MRTRELKKLLAEVPELTLTKKQVLMQALRVADDAAWAVQAAEARALACPHCQGERIVRNGQANGLQRHKCPSCAKTFNALAAAPLARLRHAKPT